MSISGNGYGCHPVGCSALKELTCRVLFSWHEPPISWLHWGLSSKSRCSEEGWSLTPSTARLQGTLRKLDKRIPYAVLSYWEKKIIFTNIYLRSQEVISCKAKLHFWDKSYSPRRGLGTCISQYPIMDWYPSLQIIGLLYECKTFIKLNEPALLSGRTWLGSAVTYKQQTTVCFSENAAMDSSINYSMAHISAQMF